MSATVQPLEALEPAPGPASEPNNGVAVPTTAAEWIRLGIALRARGKSPEAIDCFEKVVALDPKGATGWSNLGNALADAKQFSKAVEAQRRARLLAPNDKRIGENYLLALNMLAVTLRRTGQPQDAVQLFREGLTVDPHSAALWSNLGNALLDLARKAFPEGADGQPDFTKNLKDPEPWRLLKESIDCHRRAVKIKPDQQPYRDNLGMALTTCGVVLRTRRQLKPALSACREAIQVAPNQAWAWTNYGNVLKDLKFLDTAIEAHRRAITLAPDNLTYQFNLAISLAGAVQSEEAINVLDETLKRAPGTPQYRWDRALNYLRLGNYAQGWIDYEARHETGDLPDRKPPGTRWRGERYDGETLLILSEQGYGDTIWASRYLRDVKTLGGKLILECRKDLAPLMASLGIADKIIIKGTPLPKADRHIHVCSLPALYANSFESISGAPYIRPPADRIAKVRVAIGDAQGKLKVGIVWSGSTTFKANSDRAQPLRRFLDAFLLPGVQLYSLQKGPPTSELKEIPQTAITDLAPALDDFADAAAAISELDLVIMTDSAVAHLAGAMGKPVWVLLNHGAYWLWLTGREDSPWYNSVRLFRPKVWDDWTGVFDRAATELVRMSVQGMSGRAHETISAKE